VFITERVQGRLDDVVAIGAVFVGVAVSYVVLAIVVSVSSARLRARSQSRRMRPPWARGLTEWQPAGWTYGILEELLMGAAIVSAITRVALFVIHAA
jgi:hypothetical protein